MIIVEVNTRDADVQDEIAEEIDKLLSKYTDGRARWGIGVDERHSDYEYEEDE